MERLRMDLVQDIVYRLRSGQSERAIARDLGHSRITIRRYGRLAERRAIWMLWRDCRSHTRSSLRWVRRPLRPSILPRLSPTVLS